MDFLLELPVSDSGWRDAEIISAGFSVSCFECGCGLYRDVSRSGEPAWFHYGPVGSRDAAGCQLQCAVMPHDASGCPCPA